VIVRVRLGELEVFSLVENRMHLDGGAMFGVIPKKLWTRELSSDEQNLIPLDLNLLLVKTRGKTVLIDSGFGDVATERERKIYGLSTPSRLEEALSACGSSASSVDCVIFSHLHFDHSGGGLKRDASGRAITRFPRARYLVQSAEWQEALHPNERTQATYVPEYMEAYARSGQVDVAEGEREVVPGLTLRPTSGHTAGHQAIVLRGGGRALGYFADIFPTRVHLKTAWVPAVDTLPLVSLRVKKEILKSCVEESMWLAFDHDTELKLARVERAERDYRAVPLAPEEWEEVR
jgi:glyoxylase-like metal-dependent hydrolase (beta-lactamase superfamily II)